jgi:hypothetical protein
MGRRAPELAASRQVWDCKGAAQPIEQTIEQADVFSATSSVSPRSTPPSDIRALSTDEDVRTDFGAWIVVGIRPAAGSVSNLIVAGRAALRIHVLGAALQSTDERQVACS